ncbi:MAG: hypothetical protein OH338_03645 [Candidatus Parvarchaeota archaeon]|nr:hypothetical protein [Candidatus Parvarchaeum tengchongense]
MTKREILYKSSNLEDLFRFYDSFSGSDEIVLWMKHRPKARIRFYISKGSEKVCVIIPTANHNSIYAKTAKKIYKGFTIIFVESNGPYFNFARSVNRGLKYALDKYKFNWVIISNDDIYKIDDIRVLEKELNIANKRSADVLFREKTQTREVNYVYVAKINRILLLIVRAFTKGFSNKYYWYVEKFKIRFFVYDKSNKLKFYIFNIISKKKIKLYEEGAFWVLSYNFIKKNKGAIFDETYINGFEDHDLSYRVNTKYKYDFIKFNLGFYNGKSLGTGKRRVLKDLVNLIYFNYKFCTKAKSRMDRFYADK